MALNKESIKLLEDKAKKLKELKDKHGKRRPVLIEFCGTPKSGKTTSISALNIFLKRNGFNTELVGEMAGICPIPNKTHPHFNSWTLFSSLAEIIKHYSNNIIDFIIVDRSIFDALCWFQWLNTSNDEAPYLDDMTFKSYENLLIGSKLLSSLFSLTLVFKANPEVCMKREFSFLLTEKSGSIMNENVLCSFNNAIESCLKKYESKFNKIVTFDTSNEERPEEVNRLVTEKTLDALLGLIKEDIGYLPVTVSRLLQEGVNDFSIIKNEKIYFGDRDVVEETDSIQPIPIAVITNETKTKVLIVRKSDKKAERGSPERNRYLLYTGGHIRHEDKNGADNNLLEIFKNTLHREIFEEIGESIYPKDIEPFLIYNSENNKSKKHLAVCFVIRLNDFNHKNFKIVTEELVKKTGSSKSGHSLDISEVVENYSDNLEPWSSNILKHVFGAFPYDKQLDLFMDT
ncbi:NUDIX hydrolase [Ferruginibacter sp.]